MGIYLGNLGVPEIEKRLEISLTDTDRSFLNETRQEDVSINIKPGKWHCFDIPFMIICGNRSTAERLYDLFSNYKFAAEFQISWQPDKKGED